MTRSDNLVIDEDEFQRTKLLVIGKAKRYSLKKIEVSDRLITKFQPDQVKRLVAEVAERAGTIAWEIFTGIGSRVRRVYL